MKQKLTGILFLVTIFGLSVAMMLVPDREFSDMENRYLKEFPEFSFGKMADGSFAQDLESYLTDQIVLKDALVVAKNQWDRLTGKKCFGEDVYYVDGIYFQAHKYNQEQLFENIDYINGWCKKSNVSDAYFMLEPTAVQIYDRLPYGAISDDGLQTNDALAQRLNGFKSILYPVDILREHSDENVYYRTDHHWTMQGAYYGYLKLAGMLGLEPVGMEKLKRIDLEEGFLGSLYSQAPFIGVKKDDVIFYDYSNLDYTVEIDKTGVKNDSFLFEDKFAAKDKYAALFNGNHGKITITNNSEETLDKGTLLIFKDSYANSIVPYLINDYREIVMIDLRFYGDSCADLYEKAAPDKVLFLYNTDFINTDSNFWRLAY